MIPTSIQFTDLTIDPNMLLFECSNRLVSAPYPSHFTRIEFKYQNVDWMQLEAINGWLHDHVNGRWGSYLSEHTQTIVLFFEDDADAVMFKLLDGEKAYTNYLNQGM